MKDNTKEVNRILASNLLKCSVLLAVLLITGSVGIFNFNIAVKVFLVFSILFVTLMPTILIKLKVSENFLKYYMLMAVSVMICALGTSNSLGIFITYALVPVLSCLYFDAKFTRWICVFAYFTMALGVYFNCAGKLEVRFLNWSHLHTFRNYMIGFTLEFLAMMLFIIQLVKRASKFMKTQEDSLKAMQIENENQKKIHSLYKSTISDEKQSAYSILSRDIENLTPECYAALGAGQRFIVSMQDDLMYADDMQESINHTLKMVGEYFGIDRIMFIQILPEEGKSKLALQWNKESINYIDDYYDEMSVEEQQTIADVYSKKGYIELLDGENYVASNGFTNYMVKIRLGSQLWIPILEEGKYKGAICYDRKSKKPYTTAEKFLLTEASGIISSHMMRMESDYANRAKSDFLSNMSHEIRTPMNAIMGMTSVALREETSPNVKKCLNIIKSSSEGLLTIINDILDFSKIESGKIEIIPEDYRIMSLLNDVSVMANARNIEKQLEIKYEYDYDLPNILHGDFVRIKQVMINFVTNAIKYTDDGSVTIRLKCDERENDNTVLKFEVQDTGQGIKDEDIDKVFASYSQVNQELNHHKEGTGLGLTISKQLITLMGGKIGVNSTYGQGSCFFFEVPQSIVDASPAGTLDEFEYDSDDGQKVEQFTAKGAKVLIVDDNEINLMIEEELFEPFEMDVTTASSGPSAIRLIEKHSFDLIFMDHFMPEMDGTIVTKIIREMEGNPNQNIPIIALTADAMSGVKEEMLAAGMNDFLSKPIDMSKVKHILKKYLRK